MKSWKADGRGFLLGRGVIASWRFGQSVELNELGYAEPLGCSVLGRWVVLVYAGWIWAVRRREDSTGEH